MAAAPGRAATSETATFLSTAITLRQLTPGPIPAFRHRRMMVSRGQPSRQLRTWNEPGNSNRRFEGIVPEWRTGGLDFRITQA